MYDLFIIVLSVQLDLNEFNFCMIQGTPHLHFIWLVFQFYSAAEMILVKLNVNLNHIL